MASYTPLQLCCDFKNHGIYRAENVYSARQCATSLLWLMHQTEPPAECPTSGVTSGIINYKVWGAHTGWYQMRTKVARQLASVINKRHYRLPGGTVAKWAGIWSLARYDIELCDLSPRRPRYMPSPRNAAIKLGEHSRNALIKAYHGLRDREEDMPGSAEEVVWCDQGWLLYRNSIKSSLENVIKNYPSYLTRAQDYAAKRKAIAQERQAAQEAAAEAAYLADLECREK